MNKKINIITRHSIANYGSFLQTIASCKFFNELGYESIVIDYIPKTEYPFNYAKILLKNNTRYNKTIFHKCFFIMTKWIEQKIGFVKFQKYRKKNLVLTNNFKSIYELKNNKFDGILCAGSDQLWNYMPNGNIDPAYFLDFSENNIKISFSSSFGIEDFDSSTKKRMFEYLDKFKFITVREKSGSKILSELGINSNDILDPTLLVSDKFWLSMAGEKKYISQPYLLVYQLHPNDFVFEKTIEKILSIHPELKLVRVSATLKTINKSGKKYILKSPKVFLNLIKNASYVLTDSFHGTVFSLIFEKKFIIISPGKSSVRIRNILDIVELNNIMSEDGNNFSVLDAEMDYNKIKKILEDKQEQTKKLVLQLLEESDA